jgi:hypothetical protein
MVKVNVEHKFARNDLELKMQMIITEETVRLHSQGLATLDGYISQGYELLGSPVLMEAEEMISLLFTLYKTGPQK